MTDPKLARRQLGLILVRFPDDCWLFFLFSVILFVFFVLVLIVVRILWRQTDDSDKARVDEPSGNLLRDARNHGRLLECSRAHVSATKPAVARGTVGEIDRQARR